MRSGSDHPEIEALLRYRDGSLNETERRIVQAHLERCTRCAQEMERLTRSAGSTVAAPPISELLANLAQLQNRLQRPEASGEALKRRVESELIPYVGTAAAERFLQTVASSGENLLSTIEPVLRLFLGRTASARLVSRIVDRAIMRT